MYPLFPYIGSPDHLAFAQLPSTPSGLPIRSPNDLQTFLHNTQPTPNPLGILTATFVVRNIPTPTLILADRHSEHVACANAQPVLSAGEIGFLPQPNTHPTIETITNQSTGYCPPTTSWNATQHAIHNAHLTPPTFWTTPFLFRRCTSCNTTNIVKDQWFVCAVCDHDLPQDWNYTTTPAKS